MALNPHLGAQSARAVALAMVPQCFAHGYLTRESDRRHSFTALPSLIHRWGHAQHLIELAQRARGHAGGPLGHVLVGNHRVGWPQMSKAIFKRLRK